jgi:hypothetical protein
MTDDIEKTLEDIEAQDLEKELADAQQAAG